eukprot:2181527-Prymnesium_polylepis.3
MAATCAALRRRRGGASDMVGGGGRRPESGAMWAAPCARLPSLPPRRHRRPAVSTPGESPSHARLPLVRLARRT